MTAILVVRVNDVVMRMAHRGRLNMLVNVLGKKALFDEFAGKAFQRTYGDESIIKVFLLILP